MGQRILLADDSHTIRKVVELTFADTDFQVVAVQNGDLALQKIRESKPDIVLLDVIMPGKDGYEVCDLVKSDPSMAGVPVLLMAGSFEPFDKERALRVGSDGFLQKPFDSRSLIARVNELLEAARRPAPEAAPVDETMAFIAVQVPPPPVAGRQPPVPAPDQTMIFPGFKEIQATEGIGFQEFTASPEKTATGISPPTLPPEASFADLADDLKDWERAQGTQPVRIPPPEPTMPVTALPVTALPVTAPEPETPLVPTFSETPFWQAEPPPLQIEEPPAIAAAGAMAESEAGRRGLEAQEVPLWRMETPMVLEEPVAGIVEEEEREAGSVEPPLWEIEPPRAETIAAPPAAPSFKEDYMRTQESVISEIPLEPVPEQELSPEITSMEISEEPASPPATVESAKPIPLWEVPADESVIAPVSPQTSIETPAFLEPEYEKTFSLEDQPAEVSVPVEPEIEELLEMPPPEPGPVESYEQTFELEEQKESALAEHAPAAPPSLFYEPPPAAARPAPEQILIEEEAVELERVEIPPAFSSTQVDAESLLEEPAVAEASVEAPSASLGLEFFEDIVAEEAPAVPAAPVAEVLEQPVAPEPTVVAPEAALPFVPETEPPPVLPSPPSKMETIPDLLKAEPQLLKFDALPQEMVDAVARRVVEILSEKAIQEIAWEVVPDLAELLIKKEIERLQKGN
ncbi:MAG: response regulator [Acidobacteria bacterium]|nr:response regulator [Acidobacteriota bacterium]